MASVGELRRGDCVFVKGRHANGCAIKKDRPAVVISNPAACSSAPVLQVAYITKAHKPAPYHAILNDKRTVLCEQIATVDVHFLEWTGPRLNKSEISRLNKALAVQLQLDKEHRMEYV